MLGKVWLALGAVSLMGWPRRGAVLVSAGAFMCVMFNTVSVCAAQGDLLQSSEAGNLARVRILLAGNGDVNARKPNGFTPLMLASYKGHLEVVRALLDARAAMNAKAEPSGATALTVASQEGQIEVVRALLAAKADPNVKGVNGTTALIQAAQRGHTEVARALLDARRRECQNE